jgi:hypothetical protein
VSSEPNHVTKEDFLAASTAIRRTIAEGEGSLPPRFVVEFMLQEWRRYLALTHLQSGPGAPEWTEALNVTRQLLVSLQPPTSAAARTKLMQSLPRLVADLKTGMALAHTLPETRDAFLHELRELQLRLLDPSAPPVDSRPADQLSDTITMDTRDPRLRALLDRLDGANGVEHIEM